MKKHISVLNVLVFVGNISLGLIIVSNVEPTINKLKYENKLTFEHKIQEHLIANGLSESSVAIKINNSSQEMNDAVRLLCTQLNVEENKVVEVLSNRVLQKKSIDIKNVNNLIAIAQRVNSGYLSTDALNAIHEFTSSKTETIL